MKMSQKIWDILTNSQHTTVNELHKETNMNIVRISNYIRALYNAKYIKADTQIDRILHSTKISLIKNTGAIAPQLYRGILTDWNTIEEIVVFKINGKSYNHKNHKNLIPIIEALLKLGEKEVYREEIWKKAQLTSTQLSRWLPKLIDAKIVIETVEQYRNSTLFLVDLEKNEKFLTYLNQYRNHKLAFMKIKLESSIPTQTTP